MYSVSCINRVKYRVLNDSLLGAVQLGTPNTKVEIRYRHFDKDMAWTQIRNNHIFPFVWPKVSQLVTNISVYRLL